MKVGMLKKRRNKKTRRNEENEEEQKKTEKLPIVFKCIITRTFGTLHVCHFRVDLTRQTWMEIKS